MPTLSNQPAVRSSHRSSSSFALATASGTRSAAVLSSFSANSPTLPSRSIPTASRTATMVFSASAMAFSAPCRIVSCRRCWILRQLAPPLPDRRQMCVYALHRQRFAFHAGNGGLRAALSNVSEAFLIAENLVQVAHRARSGLPRSVSLGRSVTLPLIFCSTTAASSLSKMELPYDLDIFRLSVPSSLGVGVSSVCGSGKDRPVFRSCKTG